MLLRLFLLFTLVPLLELFLLLRIGALIGAGPTVLLVIGTGMAGAWLARSEGLRSWRAVRAELDEGRLPAAELLHSLLILVAGVVLVTPGVLTDLAGLLLLLRPVRRGLIGRAERSLRRGAAGGEASFGPRGGAVWWWSFSSPGPRRSEDGRPSEEEPRLRKPGGTEEEAEEGAEVRRPRVIEL